MFEPEVVVVVVIAPAIVCILVVYKQYFRNETYIALLFIKMIRMDDKNTRHVRTKMKGHHVARRENRKKNCSLILYVHKVRFTLMRIYERRQKKQKKKT